MSYPWQPAGAVPRDGAPPNPPVSRSVGDSGPEHHRPLSAPGGPGTDVPGPGAGVPGPGAGVPGPGVGSPLGTGAASPLVGEGASTLVGAPQRPLFHYPPATAYPGLGASGTRYTGRTDVTSTPATRVWPTPGGAEPSTAESRSAARYSGRFRMWFALVMAVLAVAVAAMVGGLVGYRAAADQAGADYGPRLAAAQSSVAGYEAAAAAASAASAEVPDLLAIARERFDAGADISGTSSAVEITITSSRLLTDMPALSGYLADLGFSDAVLDRMTRTRALDGTLSAQGRHCNVTWTYHPDDGLQLVFEATPDR